MAGKLHIPICAFRPEQVEELRHALASQGIEVLETDSGARGAGTPELEPFITETIRIYDRAFADFNLYSFIGQGLLWSAATTTVKTIFDWLRRSWKEEFTTASIELGLGNEIGITFRVTLECAPDEEFNKQLNKIVEQQIAARQDALPEGHQIIYLRWTKPKKILWHKTPSALVKEKGILIEGLQNYQR